MERGKWGAQYAIRRPHERSSHEIEAGCGVGGIGSPVPVEQRDNRIGLAQQDFITMDEFAMPGQEGGRAVFRRELVYLILLGPICHAVHQPLIRRTVDGVDGVDVIRALRGGRGGGVFARLGDLDPIKFRRPAVVRGVIDPLIGPTQPR